MMNRAFKWLSSEVSGLNAAFYILAASALLSSLLALMRDRLLAYTFGAGTTLDIYYAAFRIPDLIFVGTAALVSVYILIPELARRSDDEQKKYIDSVIVGFSLLAVVIAGGAMLAAPYALRLLFPQFALEGHLPQLISLTRIMLLQPVFLGLSNVLAGITQAKKRYWLYSISPLLYNAGIIFGTLVLYPAFGIVGLAWGVVLGASMHFGIQLPSIISDGFFRHVPKLHSVRDLSTTVAVSIPRALALSMSQLTFIGLTALAGTLAPGSIAVLMFAYNLQAVPLSIVGASYSVAAFPTLAAALSRGERETFLDHIAIAARYVFFWSLPLTALVIVLRAYIVRFILGSGNFDWTDTRLTAAGLALFTLSLAAQGLTLLIVRGYYAAGRTFMPFFVALGSAASTVLIAAFAIGTLRGTFISEFTQSIMRVTGVSGSGVLALIFAYALVAILSAVVLAMHFEHRFPGFFARVWRSWTESATAAIACGFGAYLMLSVVGPITLASTTLSVLAKGFAGGIVGIIVGALVFGVLQNREFEETITGLRTKLWRTRRDMTAVASAEESTAAGPQ
jgi:putative peptidoglycan lipid II flippase